ncbi:MAG: hypothetical protein IJL88_11445 [Clostridia bacterium]|nr:hypothetical protein [Clostridia bacterium]
MYRRLLAFAAAMLLLWIPPVHAGNFFDQYLLDVAMVIQRSSRYNGSLYQYNRAKFSVRGCGPSSVANAFCISASVEEQNLADKILRETMRLLTYNFEPTNAAIDIKYIERLQEPEADKFPTLSELIGHYGIWRILDTVLDGETVMAFAGETQENRKPDMLMGYYSVRSHWKELTGLIRHLSDSGMEDTIICLAFLGCGSSGTGAPFRLSDGHYASLCFHCGDFAKDKSLYLVDSNPRALPEEPLAPGKYYERYPLDLGGSMLTEQFDFVRISQGILRIRLNDQNQVLLNRIRQEEGEEAAEDAEGELFENLLLYGNGLMMVMIP